MARYLGPGYLIVARNGVLLAAPFSLEKFERTAAPQVVVSNVAGRPSNGISYFDLSGSGELVFIPGNPNEELQLVWVDRKGRIDPLPLPPKPYGIPRISPDGNKYDLTSEVFSRFTFEGGMWCPAWRRRTSFDISNQSGDRSVLHPHGHFN